MQSFFPSNLSLDEVNRCSPPSSQGEGRGEVSKSHSSYKSFPPDREVVAGQSIVSTIARIT